MTTAKKVALALLPVAVMIALIPQVPDDYLLAGIYAAVIAAALLVRYEKNDGLAFLVGTFGMTVSELFFISTGVETFERVSLFGVMPLWLPLLWGYGFVAIT